MSYNLFLDDIRDPIDGYLYDEHTTLFESTRELDWVIVRHYDDFVKCIKENGPPKIVSFDHDLHFEHLKYFGDHTVLNDYIEYSVFKHKTGKHCAEFLVEFVKDNKFTPPLCYVHSANPVGRREIKKILDELKS